MTTARTEVNFADSNITPLRPRVSLQGLGCVDISGPRWPRVLCTSLQASGFRQQLDILKQISFGALLLFVAGFTCATRPYDTSGKLQEASTAHAQMQHLSCSEPGGFHACRLGGAPWLDTFNSCVLRRRSGARKISSEVQLLWQPRRVFKGHGILADGSHHHLKAV